MMRGIRRLVVLTAATGLLAAGTAVTVSIETAHADTTVTSCIGASDSSTAYECTLSGTVSDPESITVTVTDDTSGAYEEVTVDVTTLTCTDSSATDSEPASSEQGATTLTDAVTPLPANAADSSCDVEATVDLVPPYTADAYSECLDTTATPSPVATPDPTPTSTPPACPTEYTATLSYTSAASASASATTTAASVKPVKGYSSMCLDDKGNSSANKAKIIIWSCSSTDQAQSWNWTDNELRHNGKCVNDQGDGGSGTHQILYACSGAANDKWSELANGELKLKAHNGTLCLNDPAYSKKNGTQLIVYKCTDSANEKWSLP